MSSKFQGIKRKLKNKKIKVSDLDTNNEYEYEDDDDSSIISHDKLNEHIDMIVSKQVKSLTSSDILKQIEDGVPHHLLGHDDDHIRSNIDINNNNNKLHENEIYDIMEQPSTFKEIIPEVHDTSKHDETKWDDVIKDRMKAIDLKSILGLASKTKKQHNFAKVTEDLMNKSKSPLKNKKNEIDNEQSEEKKASLRENWIKKSEEEGLKKAQAEAALIRIKLEAELKEKEKFEKEHLEKLRIEQEVKDKERAEQEAVIRAKQEAYEKERLNIIKLERERIEKEQAEKQIEREEQMKKLEIERLEKERLFEEEQKRIQLERQEKERLFDEERKALEQKLEQDRIARAKELEDIAIDQEKKFEERRKAMEQELEQQRLLQLKKDEEERIRREKELEERLEMEKMIQKQLEDGRLEREKVLEGTRKVMEQQLEQQRLIQKQQEDERLERERVEHEKRLAEQARLEKELEDKQKDTEQKLQEMKIAMEKKFEDERKAREKKIEDDKIAAEKSLAERLSKERQLEELRVKNTIQLDALLLQKNKEDEERLERERFEHQQRLQEIEHMAKHEARDHIDKLTKELTLEQERIQNEILNSKINEASSSSLLLKEKKAKEMERFKVEEFSKALADEQRKLMEQMQIQSENDDGNFLEHLKNRHHNTVGVLPTDASIKMDNNNNNNNNNNNSNNDNSFEFNTSIQPPDPQMIMNKIEINYLNMAFTPELKKAMLSSSSSSSNKIDNNNNNNNSNNSNKPKKEKQIESDTKRMKSVSIDDEIATVASFLSKGDRVRDSRSTKEKQLDVDIALKKAALQQKIALQELAEARLEVNIAVMKSQKKLIEKIAKDVFDEKKAKSKPRQLMKAATMLSETMKNNRQQSKRIVPLKKSEVSKRAGVSKNRSGSRRPSHDSLTSISLASSEKDDDLISVSSSRFDDNISVLSDDGSFFITAADDDSSIMSMESMGSLESIDESIDDLGFRPPKKYKWTVIGKFSSHKSAEVAKQMATQSFDNRPSIDDTKKHGRQKFELNGDLLSSMLGSDKKKKKKGPIKPKYRSARVRFDLQEQLWFVEAPVVKRKKKVIEADDASNRSIATDNLSKSKSADAVVRGGRAVNRSNNTNRSRSSSLRSNSSNNSKVTKRVENSNIDTNLPKMRAQESNIINENMNNLRENKVSLQALKKENRVRDQQIQKQKPPSDGGRKMKSKGNTLTFPKILESFNNK